MERILLRHIGGSRSSQVDEFPARDLKEILIGRDPLSNVRYDPERDDLVSRRHTKITLNPADPSQVMITDLDSRNGTFVNKQRIAQTVRLMPGDIVQLGAGGPEFQFAVVPPEDTSLKLTRLATKGFTFSMRPK